MTAISKVKDGERRMELVRFLTEKGADVTKADVRHFPHACLPPLRRFLSCVYYVPLGWLAVVLIPAAASTL